MLADISKQESVICFRNISLQVSRVRLKSKAVARILHFPNLFLHILSKRCINWVVLLQADQFNRNSTHKNCVSRGQAITWSVWYWKEHFVSSDSWVSHREARTPCTSLSISTGNSSSQEVFQNARISQNVIRIRKETVNTCYMQSFYNRRTYLLIFTNASCCNIWICFPIQEKSS